MTGDDLAGELREELRDLTDATGGLAGAMAGLDDEDMPPEVAARLEEMIGRAEALVDEAEALAVSSPAMLAARRLKRLIGAGLDAGLTPAETRARVEAVADGCELGDEARGFLARAIEEGLADAG